MASTCLLAKASGLCPITKNSNVFYFYSQKGCIKGEFRKEYREMSEKRIITEKQEQALRLCHSDFQGLEQSKAADIMGITQQAISRLLAAVEKVMPESFPLLTKAEAERYHLYTVEGWSVEEIAEHLGLTPNSVYKALQRVKDKGMCFTKPKGRALSYDESMDDNIKQQF